MAFNSGKCVLCEELTKRAEGTYCGKDEKGSYSGPMYTCDNISCSINFERRKLQKQVTILEEKKIEAEKKPPLPKEKEHKKKRPRAKR